MEYEELYKKIDLSKPWNDPVNKVFCETPMREYSCPSSPAPANCTQYLAVVAPGGCFQTDQPRKLRRYSTATP